MRRLLRAAGNPHRRGVATLVAGTNGKGSTSATLASILTISGFRTGLYTSPHLVRLNERWKIDGEEVSNADLNLAIAELQDTAVRAGTVPTYFEALTMLAFLIFRRSGCEHSVLEVGMGGRLDATNVVRPRISVVTNVALDHQEFLGTTIRRIAREKAGVIHRGSTAITASRDADVIGVLRRRCEKLDVPLHVLPNETSTHSVRITGDGTSFALRTSRREYRLRTPLAGLHQIDNVTAAVCAAELLGAGVESIIAGVAATKWEGRAQRLRVSGRDVIVDGAHNPAGAAAIAALLESTTAAPRLLVFAAMRDKQWREMLTRLAPLFESMVCTIADPDRGETPETIAAFARGLGVRTVTRRSVSAALRHTMEERDAATIVVTGSLYLAGAALPWLERHT